MDSLVSLVDEPRGAQCPAGGTRIQAGPDLDGDGTLDANEVTQTSYVCNGTAGSAPANALVSTAPEAAGANCAAGGVAVMAGVDTNGNSALDTSEVTSTTYVCNGARGDTGPAGTAPGTLVVTGTEPPSANCAAGGVFIRTGVDDNTNGQLEEGEVDSTSWVCNTARPTPVVCERVLPLTAGVLHGSTAGNADHFVGCANTFGTITYTVGSGAPDEVWSLQLDRRTRVTLSVEGFDAAIYVREGATCEGAFLVHNACRDMEVAAPEVLSVVLDPGQYWVVVDGYADASMVTAGPYTLRVALEDPCGEELPSGRCDGPGMVSWCIVPPSGYRVSRTATSACPAGQVCNTVDGLANCMPDPLSATCEPGTRYCRSATQLAVCETNGQPTLYTCTNGCEDSIVGAACRDGMPSNVFTGNLRYEYVLPTPELTDWSTEARDAPWQKALVYSWHWNGTDYVLLDATTTDADGHFSVRVATRPHVNDVVAAYAAYNRPMSPDSAFMVAEPAVGDGVNPIEGVSSGQVYSWTLTPASQGSGRTWVVPLAAGSGVIRVFDGMRMIFENTAQLFYRDLPAKSMVAWMRLNSSWTCGECLWSSPTSALGTTLETQMFINGNTEDAQYWADAVTVHEAGHWVMSSFGTSPGEGGPHFLGVPYFPGLGWSEGWATFLSADWRQDTRYVDKQGGTMFWVDIGRRVHSDGLAWPRPVPADGLLGRIYENEVSALLYRLAQDPELTANPLYRALASPRAATALRGYTRRTWDVNAQGQPVNVVNTGIPAPVFPDFLDALVCASTVPDVAARVDAVLQPATHYPYPSNNPICP